MEVVYSFDCVDIWQKLTQNIYNTEEYISNQFSYMDLQRKSFMFENLIIISTFQLIIYGKDVL